jgi:tRNA(fMet)-specific endonuclease VapC
MKYLLDTNVCIRYINGRSQKLLLKLSKVPRRDVFVCSVVKAELFVGSAKSNNPATTLMKQQDFLRRFVSLPFDDAAAVSYGRVRGQLEQQGKPIGPLDMMIAAIALANQVTLVTSNTREFGRVPDLQLEDWDA